MECTSEESKTQKSIQILHKSHAEGGGEQTDVEEDLDGLPPEPVGQGRSRGPEEHTGNDQSLREFGRHAPVTNQVPLLGKCWHVERTIFGLGFKKKNILPKYPSDTLLYVQYTDIRQILKTRILHYEFILTSKAILFILTKFQFRVLSYLKSAYSNFDDGCGKSISQYHIILCNL